MWTRKELKERAKEALKRNYWKIVLVSLIGILIGGSVGSTGASSNIGENISDNVQENISQHYHDIEENNADWEGADARLDDMQTGMTGAEAVAIIFIVVVALIVVAIALLIGIVFDVLLLNPIKVGVDRFMLKSVDDTAKIAEVGYTFDHNYKNGVKVMFFKDLYVVLWSLLFIIPGVYKSYQYRMVSYILAENPDMPYKEVLQRSKDMMNGQKWNAFVLDLSFILWHILGGITCGLVEVFYVAPYVNLTDAALYRQLTRQPEQIPDTQQE